MQCAVRYSRVEEMGKNEVRDILMLGEERGMKEYHFVRRLLGFARSSF